MLRTMVTILSLAFGCAMYINKEIHTEVLHDRNNELMVRLSSVTTTCADFGKRYESVLEQKNKYKTQLAIMRRNRKGHAVNLAKLKKQIKERNLKYGIGGNE